MIKDLKIFIGIFLVLALGMHFKAWTEHPVEHVQSLFTQGWFALYPLVVTLVVFLLYVLIHAIVRFLKR